MHQSIPLELSYFVILRIVTLLVGLSFAVMGFVLFLKGCSQTAGSVETTWVKIKKAAPGTFYAVAGTAIICITLYVSEIEREVQMLPPTMEDDGELTWVFPTDLRQPCDSTEIRAWPNDIRHAPLFKSKTKFHPQVQPDTEVSRNPAENDLVSVFSDHATERQLPEVGTLPAQSIHGREGDLDDNLASGRTSAGSVDSSLFEARTRAFDDAPEPWRVKDGGMWWIIVNASVGENFIVTVDQRSDSAVVEVFEGANITSEDEVKPGGTVDVEVLPGQSIRMRDGNAGNNLACGGTCSGLGSANDELYTLPLEQEPKTWRTKDGASRYVVLDAYAPANYELTVYASSDPIVLEVLQDAGIVCSIELEAGVTMNVGLESGQSIRLVDAIPDNSRGCGGNYTRFG